MCQIEPSEIETKGKDRQRKTGKALNGEIQRDTQSERKCCSETERERTLKTRQHFKIKVEYRN